MVVTEQFGNLNCESFKKIVIFKWKEAAIKFVVLHHSIFFHE